MRELSDAELIAVGGAVCYFACAHTDLKGMSTVDMSMMMDLSALAVTLVKSSGIDPTTLKDLGLEFVKEAKRRGEEASTDEKD